MGIKTNQIFFNRRGYCFPYLALIVCMGLLPLCSLGQVGKPLPLWEKGYLDIHHINTGKGDAAFFMLPDGTTMLVDAGASNRPPGGPREMDAKPDDSRSPGEWISRYINHMLQGQPVEKLNYMLLTHFHSDHMGGLLPGGKISVSGGYKLAGITEVGDLISFDKMIDRAWPEYNWPIPLENKDMQNYRQFLEWHIQNNGAEVEQFQVGQKDQLALVHQPQEYPDFEIRNIAANGHIWTGVGNNVRNHFPPIEDLTEDLPSENMCSIAFRLSYGRFDYFTGGDMPGLPSAGSPEWQDVETPVAKAVGPVEVNVANHHAHFDAQNEFFIRFLRPKVHIIQSWVVNHPSPSTLSRMLSERLYPGDRDIFATNIKEETRIFIGSGIEQIKSQQGHIVVRVAPKGESFKVFILDDSDESFNVKAIYGPYTCD